MNKYVTEILGNIKSERYDVKGEGPGLTWLHLKTFERGQWAYAKTTTNLLESGFITESRGDSRYTRLDTGDKYVKVLKVNTFSGLKIDIVAQILDRFAFLHRARLGKYALQVIRQDVLKVCRKFYKLGSEDMPFLMSTKKEIRDFILIGHKEDQVVLDQLNLINSNYTPESSDIERRIFLGIALTNDINDIVRDKGRWFAREFRDDRFAEPVKNWAGRLNDQIYAGPSGKYFDYVLFQELQKRFFDKFPLRTTVKFPTPAYRKDFYWYSGSHFYTKEILNSEEYGFLYEVEKDRNRKFKVYVPEAYLHICQPYLRGPNDLTRGNFCCLPGHNGVLYRYHLTTNTLGQFAEIETLDKYKQIVPSALLIKPDNSTKYEKSVAEVHSTGLQLFQTIETGDSTVFVSALTKDGKIVVFNGHGHIILPEKQEYSITTKSKFEVGDNVTNPHTKFFDFGKIVYKRSIKKDKHVFWEYAILINEHHREGVFFYPEAMLILLPTELIQEKVVKKARRVLETTSAPPVQHVAAKAGVIEQRIRYATTATILILLYALI